MAFADGWNVFITRNSKNQCIFCPQCGLWARKSFAQGTFLSLVEEISTLYRSTEQSQKYCQEKVATNNKKATDFCSYLFFKKYVVFGRNSMGFQGP